MNLYTVCEKENLSIDNVEVGKAKGSKSGVVIDAGSKRYVMFPDEASAKRYAIRINKDSFDDESERKIMDIFDINIKDYIETMINNKGLAHLLSFDGKHKMEMRDGSLCFRVL